MFDCRTEDKHSIVTPGLFGHTAEARGQRSREKN